MTTKLALEYAYDSVVAAFAADNLLVDQDFGWREVSQHNETGRPRITWVPGDPSDSLGAVGGARGPGQYPRPIAQLRERFTVYLFGVDTRDPDNERAQYHVARQLFDAWYCAMYAANTGNFAVVDQAWLNTQTERRHGATIRVVCEINAPIVEARPDEPLVDTDAGLSDVVDAVAHAVANDDHMTADVTVEMQTTEETTEVAAGTDDDSQP